MHSQDGRLLTLVGWWGQGGRQNGGGIRSCMHHGIQGQLWKEGQQRHRTTSSPPVASTAAAAACCTSASTSASTSTSTSTAAVGAVAALSTSALIERQVVLLLHIWQQHCQGLQIAGLSAPSSSSCRRHKSQQGVPPPAATGAAAASAASSAAAAWLSCHGPLPQALSEAGDAPREALVARRAAYLTSISPLGRSVGRGPGNRRLACIACYNSTRVARWPPRLLSVLPAASRALRKVLGGGGPRVLGCRSTAPAVLTVGAVLTFPAASRRRRRMRRPCRAVPPLCRPPALSGSRASCCPYRRPVHDSRSVVTKGPGTAALAAGSAHVAATGQHGSRRPCRGRF